MTQEHGLPIVRACQAARLSRAAYYRPGIDAVSRDADVIAALQRWSPKSSGGAFGNAITGCAPKGMPGTTSGSGAKRYSDHPDYQRIAEKYWYEGLRKAGFPEQ